ncbi:MAG: UDP-N-acetylmuramate dehydrogenase [Candidatus Fermentibacteraceae bacterium]|nr:UDP-N-acetylmuramate dehydrogenase [Candidatus Fermentibacteraceae bacterium]MBN2609439.1 UDP-N-acetylmuramate dehydrogenase [Candidatus Fermentibacteraceae bacterium]
MRRDGILKLLGERFTDVSEEYMSSLTTWRTGGPAVVITAGTSDKLAGILDLTFEEGVPWFVLGQGSNVLAADSGCSELIIRLGGELSSHTWSSEGALWELSCGGGAHLPSMSGAACTRGAAGLEFAVGIPGTVGGAIFMNAGAYGSSVSRTVSSVKVLDRRGSVRIIPGEECGFDYRRSMFQDERLIIASAVMRLGSGDPEDLRSEARRILELRRERFPLEYPNAGSVFRKPADDIPPGRLIEGAGLKGRTVGGAMVSRKHANFIINTGSATSDDIRKLIDVVRKTVLDFSGIMLEEEIRYLGGRK